MKQEEIACVAIKYADIGVLALPAPARHHHVMWTRLFDRRQRDCRAMQSKASSPPKGGSSIARKALAIATADQIVEKHGNPTELLQRGHVGHAARGSRLSGSSTTRTKPEGLYVELWCDTLSDCPHVGLTRMASKATAGAR
jgi:hypothetical protein